MTGLRGEAAIVGIAELPAERKQTRPPSFTLDQYALLAKMVVDDAGVDPAVVNGLVLPRPRANRTCSRRPRCPSTSACR